MICNKCGTQNDDNAIVCRNCGESFSSSDFSATPDYTVETSQQGKTLAIISVVCGALAFIFGICCGCCLGVILGIVAIVLAVLAKNKGCSGALPMVGIVLGALGIVTYIGWFIAGAVLNTAPLTNEIFGSML